MLSIIIEKLSYVNIQADAVIDIMLILSYIFEVVFAGTFIFVIVSIIRSVRLASNGHTNYSGQNKSHSQYVICPYCDSKVKKKNNNCPNCGGSLKDAENNE